MRKTFIKKTGSGLCLFFMLLVVIPAETEHAVSVQAGLNTVFAYDLGQLYPHVPGHSPVCVVLSFSRSLSEQWAVEAIGGYTSRTHVDLSGSGTEYVPDYRTADHLDISVNFKYFLRVEQVFNPFLTWGAGLDFLLVSDENYPDSRDNWIGFKYYDVDPVFNFGAGAYLFVNARTSVRADIRLLAVWDAPDVWVFTVRSVLGVSFIF